MNLRQFANDDRAVSPVVGVALLIAIAVILAAVIGAVVLGLGTGGAETPQAQLQGDVAATDTGGEGDVELEITHNGGEPLPAGEIKITDSNGEDWELAEDLTAGQTAFANDFVDNADADEADQTEMGDDTDGAGAELNPGDGDVAIVWEDPNSDSETVLEEFEIEDDTTA